MYLKIHESAKGSIVAVCDEDLIGKVLDDGKAYLDLDRYRGFYVGEKASKGAVEKALSSFSSANLVGKEAVSVAISLGLAGEEDVMRIKSVPCIQLYRL